jgi:uncharacterized protein YozE (UPF0346 family)
MNKEKYKNLEQYDMDQCLIDACISNDMQLVKYLLTSPELSKHADINAMCNTNGMPLRTAFLKKNFELAHYLLTSSELKEHANIHISNDDIFRTAFFKKHNDVLECLVFTYEIERTKNIDSLITKHTDTYGSSSDYVEKLFRIRSLNKDLNNELAPKEHTPGKKNKI